MKTLIVKHKVVIKRIVDWKFENFSAGEWVLTIVYSEPEMWEIVFMQFTRNILCLFDPEPSEYILSEETFNELIDQAIYADMHSFEQRRDERAEMSARD